MMYVAAVPEVDHLYEQNRKLSVARSEVARVARQLVSSLDMNLVEELRGLLACERQQAVALAELVSETKP